MNKHIAIIHTSFVSVEVLKQLFQEIIPEANIHNLVDDSLLAEVMENNEITQGIIKRMTNYVQMAESIGADAILSQCSSMGEAVDIASKIIQIPVLKIDQAMADKAVTLGNKIAVVATVASTMKPSCTLIKEAAQKMNKEIEIVEALVNGALDILLNKGDRETHNRLVLEQIKKLDGKCDVIVLAQGSMIVLLPFIKDIKTPVLTSPELGVRKMREILNLP